MKTIGEVLKSAREEKGLTIDQAVHETNISREFIEALESESFDMFPAETYLIGFLKNYSGFLDLDPEKSVGMYRNYVLSLEPTPIEELIGSTKNVALRRYLILGALAVLAVLVGFFGAPWLIKVIRQFGAERTASIETLDGNLSARELYPESPFWEGKVRLSDIVVLKDAMVVEGDAEEAELRLVIVEVGEKLQIDGMERGKWLIRLGEEIYIANSLGQPAWRVYLKDIGLIGGGAIIEIQELDSGESEFDVFARTPGLSSDGNSEEEGIQALREGARATEPFVLNIVFQDFCLLRYQVDSEKTLEAYYREGDSIRLDVVSGVSLWGSNAGAVNARIGEEELKLGRDGEVFVYSVMWLIDEFQETYDLFSVSGRTFSQ